jgi:hypothetical protein
MPLVFEFLSLNMTGQHGQGWMEPLKSLNAGHLIGTPHMGTLRREHGSCWETSHTVQICSLSSVGSSGGGASQYRLRWGWKALTF